MKKILFAGVAFALVPFISFAQTAGLADTNATATVATVTTVDPGLIPGDFFYFLDKWSEGVNTFFTFNKEKKAQKHLEYAKERVAEMKEVLKKPEAKLADIASAKDDFDAQVADAATLVKEEKDKGNDVSDLARELDDELNLSLIALKDVFREHVGRSGHAESVIREKLAALPADAPQINGLNQALESVTKEKSDTRKESDDLDAGLLDEESLFEEVMGAQMAAEKHMEQASRLRDRLEGALGQVPARASEQLKQAEEAIQRGDFEEAKRMSKEAERAIETINKSNEDRPPVEMPAMKTTDGVLEGDDMGAGDLDNLESEMKKGERMMEDFNR